MLSPPGRLRQGFGAQGGGSHTSPEVPGQHRDSPALLVFQPCMFTDATDAWTFPSRWDRIKVSAAGVMSEIILASAAAFVWISSDPGLIKQVSYTLMITCTVHTLLCLRKELSGFGSRDQAETGLAGARSAGPGAEGATGAGVLPVGRWALGRMSSVRSDEDALDELAILCYTEAVRKAKCMPSGWMLSKSER